MVPRDDILATPADGSTHSGVPALEELTRVAEQLSTRCVKESRRETWFVVNETDATIEWVTVPLEAGRTGTISRVRVNGEASTFCEVDKFLAIELIRPLRAGQGTIVVVQYR
jgi:hypothetical protein